VRSAHAVLAVVRRSGVVESMHAGTAVALGADGQPVAAAGDPAATVLARSALKPLQVVAMLRAGLSLDGALLALASASHSGERFHLDGVRRMLAGGGVPEEALLNTPDLPFDEDERLGWRLTGRRATPLAQNCSGKHAAMVLTCRENAWPLDTYCSPDHPLQQQIAETVAELAGEPVRAIAVDGCGAPALGVTVTGLARGFARLAVAPPGTAEARVAAAIRRHPEWLGGTGRGVTRLLAAVPGLIAKDGAEAVFAAALPDGRAVAVKIGDGSLRPVLPVVVALLRRLGTGGTALDDLADVAVLGHGQRVGSVEVTGL
jgi:L-asparaginase II